MANTRSRHEGGTGPLDGIVISDSVSNPTQQGPARPAAPAHPLTPPRTRADLADLDTRLGPITLDTFTLSRVELYDMGARLNGRTLDRAPPLQDNGQPLLDGLQFEPEQLRQHLLTGDAGDARPIDVLFEIASRRSSQAPLILGAGRQPLSHTLMRQLEQLLVRLQGLQILAHKYVTFSLPGWVDAAKSRGMLTSGAGMQAYGIYSGLVGIREALKTGNVSDAAVNSGSIVTELTSILLERGLRKTGETLLGQGGRVFLGFRATSAGLLISRSAGLLGNVLTLPFDIHNAVTAFRSAANSHGKEAMDHYVTAGFSVASAALSVALGAAAAAGFSSAGPLGLVACAVLIVGAKIYGAVRQVDDIDDYIELSIKERWRSGWFAFTGQALDREVIERYQVERTRVDHDNALQTRARALLDGEMRDTLAGIVNGTFHVELEPVKHWAAQWQGEQQPHRLVQVPVVRDGDDVIDASSGLEQVPRAINATPGNAGKAVLWQLGGGNDQVIGVRAQPNYFVFANGTKSLTGGDHDDAFVFQVPQSLDAAQAPAISSLHGGDGQDTLSLQGQPPPGNRRHFIGHEVDLLSGKLALRRHPADLAPPVQATLTAIEHVETLAGGNSRVTGTAEANHITLLGLDDQANAGEGDDRFTLKGAESRVAGGPGKDHYRIFPSSRRVIIDEDGREPSIVELAWPMERIQRWRIVDTDLIVTSLRDEHGEQPAHQLTLRGVYRDDNGRRLQNDLLLFATQDGYLFKPNLPATLEGTDDRDIQVTTLTLGQLPPAPQPVNGGEYRLPGGSTGSYCFARNTPDTTFQVTADDTRPATTLFLDYDSAEIEQVSARYQVAMTRVGAFNYLHYSDASLTLRFSDQAQLTLKDWMVKGAGKPTDVGGALHTSGLDPNHRIVLVLRDGSSYKVGALPARYFEDQHNLGTRTLDGRDALQRCRARRLFRTPENRDTLLREHPQRVDFHTGSDSTIYNLQGMSSTYELHPRAGATLHLSTPGALAKVANASTWYIHAPENARGVARSDIRISPRQFWIDNVRVVLPADDDPQQPLDLIYIVLTSGETYEVDRLFNQLLLHELDARAYPDIDALQHAIEQHQAANELASHRVRVKSLRVTTPSVSGTRTEAADGAIHYDTLTRQWSRDGDDSAVVDPRDLFIHTPR
ncbi:hypothetical protein SAMN05216581_3009 [Pseudomonas asplenii]|uniref:Uncharacterized protein n=1 Tax=Pseudomonas asplenii TaxID=53407 RepID=A0A1H6NJN5_9PSED|nr:hypothetical protein [Pseudomonas fuscovaginae]SEI15680.1 hypothetical protein SAMN05216581_3009 [Pseudomonas fuscovaginae]